MYISIEIFSGMLLGALSFLGFFLFLMVLAKLLEGQSSGYLTYEDYTNRYEPKETKVVEGDRTTITRVVEIPYMAPSSRGKAKASNRRKRGSKYHES